MLQKIGVIKLAAYTPGRPRARGLRPQTAKQPHRTWKPALLQQTYRGKQNSNYAETQLHSPLRVRTGGDLQLLCSSERELCVRGVNEVHLAPLASGTVCACVYITP